MYRIITSSKDTYITNKIIKNKFRATDANVGQAGTLDLFKLYGETTSGSIVDTLELSRILIKFDLDQVRKMHQDKLIDVGDSSFNATVKLFDVYGGQTTPSNFKLISLPLAQKFDEGFGYDIVNFSDLDSTNWVTASSNSSVINTWNELGASKSGSLGDSNIDTVVSGTIQGQSSKINLSSEQLFVDGTEDLKLDVTPFISASVKSLIDNHGFLITYSGSYEKNNKTYFVKRFGSRDSSNKNLRPQLIIKYDDSILDNHQNFEYDITGSLYLNNFNRGQFANIVSGSKALELSGEKCMILKVQTGSFSKQFDVSQVLRGSTIKSTATFTLSDKPNEETFIQLTDVDGNIVSFEIDNENNGLKKSTATFTFSDKPDEGSTITIIDSNETSVTFEIDNEANGVVSGNVAVNNIYASGGGATGTAVDLVAKINAQSSLDIVATNPSGAVVLLTQGTGGRSGNTIISVNDPTHWGTKTSVDVPSAFTGGVGDVAVNQIAGNGGGATGTAVDLVAKINASDSLNITATRDGNKVTLIQDAAGPLGDLSITNNFNALALSVQVPATFTGGSFSGLTGIYSSSFAISSFDSNLYDHVLASGSIKFNEIWSNRNETVTYLSSSLMISKNNITSISYGEQKILVTITNLKQRYRNDEFVRIRVYAQNEDREVIFKKKPIDTPSEIFSNMFYRVRDTANGKIIIPFDDINNSTKLSSDNKGMYFDFYMSSLSPGRTYSFDFLINQKGFNQVISENPSKFSVE